MMSFVITIHVIACILLIVLVLIQRGRGGGLVDSFSGVESMFGTKTNAFLTRVTTVFAIVFFFTCLGLALLSVKKSKSLIGDTKPAASQSSTEAPKQETLPVAPAEPNQPLQGATK